MNSLYNVSHEDYTLITNMEHSFTSGDRRLDITVNVTNDDVYEMIELQGVISVDPGIASRIFIDIPMTIVKIVDDDCKRK